jgi:hypothetical protein
MQGTVQFNKFMYNLYNLSGRRVEKEKDGAYAWCRTGGNTKGSSSTTDSMVKASTGAHFFRLVVIFDWRCAFLSNSPSMVKHRCAFSATPAALMCRVPHHLGLATTVIRCIRPYIWWFSCLKYRVYTYIWFWPTLATLHLQARGFRCSQGGQNHTYVRIRYL